MFPSDDENSLIVNKKYPTDEVEFVSQSQITRCYNCTLAYAHKDPTNPNLQPGCKNDEVDGILGYTVPCFSTDPTLYDFMGMSVRTKEYR